MGLECGKVKCHVDDMLVQLLTHDKTCQGDSHKVIVGRYLLDLKALNEAASPNEADKVLQAAAEMVQAVLLTYVGGFKVRPGREFAGVVNGHELNADTVVNVMKAQINEIEGLGDDKKAEIIRKLGIESMTTVVNCSELDDLRAVYEKIIALMPMMRMSTVRTREVRGHDGENEKRNANYETLRAVFDALLLMYEHWKRIINDARNSTVFAEKMTIEEGKIQFNEEFLKAKRAGNEDFASETVYTGENTHMSLKDFFYNLKLYLGVIDLLKPCTAETFQDYEQNVRFHVEKIRPEGRNFPDAEGRVGLWPEHHSMKSIAGNELVTREGINAVIGDCVKNHTEYTLIVADHVGFGAKNINWALEHIHEAASWDSPNDEAVRNFFFTANDKGTKHLRETEIAFRKELGKIEAVNLDDIYISADGGDELVILIRNTNQDVARKINQCVVEFSKSHNMRAKDAHSGSLVDGGDKIVYLENALQQLKNKGITAEQTPAPEVE